MSVRSQPGGAHYPSLQGKRVLVTGGASGIGACIVASFAEQGSRVAFFDKDRAAGEGVVARLGGPGRDMRFLLQDLTDITSTQAAIAALAEDWGATDVLVNNAANDDRHEIAAITPEYWDERMAVNLRHYFFCAQAVAPGMQAAGGGAVINVGSISWHIALPDLVIYQTAKAGIEGLTRSMARDWGEHGIRVNCVVPGGVVTPRQMELWHDEAGEQQMLQRQCLKERVRPHDVAAMILFLASDDARMCTGHNYFVDAGWR